MEKPLFEFKESQKKIRKEVCTSIYIHACTVVMVTLVNYHQRTLSETATSQIICMLIEAFLFGSSLLS